MIACSIWQWAVIATLVPICLTIGVIVGLSLLGLIAKAGVGIERRLETRRLRKRREQYERDSEGMKTERRWTP